MLLASLLCQSPAPLSDHFQVWLGGKPSSAALLGPGPPTPALATPSPGRAFRTPSLGSCRSVCLGVQAQT